MLLFAIIRYLRIVQAISDKINEILQPHLPFIDVWGGFVSDWIGGEKDSIIVPVGCNLTPNCTDKEKMYLLPESGKNGIVFYDNIKLKKLINLECDNVIYEYEADIVIWVNKTIRVTNNPFCSLKEFIHNILLKHLNKTPTVTGVGIWTSYNKRWKFEDRIKFLQHPYTAFRVPFSIETELCLDDLPAVEFEEIC